MTGIPSSSEINRMSKAELLSAATRITALLAGNNLSAAERAQLLLALQQIKHALHFRSAPRP